MTVLDREPIVESQSNDFKTAKRDRNPVFREKVVDGQSMKVTLDLAFDPDPIVKEINSNYTASQRELMASKFHEIAAMIAPQKSSEKQASGAKVTEKE